MCVSQETLILIFFEMVYFYYEKDMSFVSNTKIIYERFQFKIGGPFSALMIRFGMLKILFFSFLYL